MPATTLEIHRIDPAETVVFDNSPVFENIPIKACERIREKVLPAGISTEPPVFRTRADARKKAACAQGSQELRLRCSGRQG